MRAATFRAAFTAFIIVILVAAPQAQQAAPPSQTPAFGATAGIASARNAAGRATDGEVATDVDLLVGRSTVLNIGATIARVSLTVPDVADAMVTGPGQLLIHGKTPGTISLFVWERGGAIRTYAVNVRRDLSILVEQMKQLFPAEPITVAGSGKDVVISGTVSSKYVVEKAADVAGGFVEKKENVVNLLKQAEGVASNQVLLRVRFAEVSRNALQELGASLFSDGNNGYNGRTTTQQFAAPFFDQTQAIQGKNLVFSDYLNLFLFDTKNQLGAVVKAMQSKGVFQSLAEPNLIALNGKEASFLAGGEFPYPVPTGINQVTIHFKEFGVRLNFTPTVLGGDLINLKIKPEVSSLDFNNAVVLDGFRVPALSTRRADTEIELRDGQTFAIAGLMNNTALSSMRKVPGLGDIPVLGYLFRSRAYQKDQTELVVMVTPQILRRDSTGASEGLPSLVEPYLPSPSKTYPNPAPYVGSPRYPGNQPAQRTSEPAPAPAPAPAPTTQPVPVARPIQGEAALPVLAPAVVEASPVVVAPPPMAAPKLTKNQMKALEKQHEQERRDAEAAAKQKALDDKRDAEEARAAQRKAEEDHRAAEKLDKERAIREAEVAKKNAELARKKAEEDQKKDRALAEAAARLKQAQAAYQAEMEKAKGIKK
jgi:pilus assembly protein CpaC